MTIATNVRTDIWWYPEWAKFAACLKVPLERIDRIFFTGQTGGREEAKRICRTCPVITNCLQYGMEIPSGIYGGKTALERWRMRGKNGRPEKASESWFYDPRYSKHGAS